MTLQLKLFGRLDVTHSPNALSVSLRPRAQRLLAYLLLHRHAPATRETAAFTLWPDHTQTESRERLGLPLSPLDRADQGVAAASAKVSLRETLQVISGARQEDRLQGSAQC